MYGNESWHALLDPFTLALSLCPLGKGEGLTSRNTDSSLLVLAIASWKNVIRRDFASTSPGLISA
jgi:hypothetical protein